MSIFKTYDIRGVYPSELNKASSYAVGKALGGIIGRSKVFLNLDTRLGSKRIKGSVLKGLKDSGANISDLGMGPIMVPAVASFIERSFGISITASHNPAEYTGVIAMRSGVTIDPKQIERRFSSHRFIDGNGSVRKCNYTQKYVDLITRGSDGSGISVGADSMGGGTTYILKNVFNGAGIRHVAVRKRPSEGFYGMHPEPSTENVADLSRVVARDKLDFGVQFDADGDRVAFVDEKGRFIDPVTIGLILIKHCGFKRVVANVSCPSIIEKYSNVKYSRVGHTFIEAELAGGKYDFGIETSSHYYFGKYHPFSDGLLASVLFARIAAESGETASDMVKSIPEIHYKADSLHFGSEDERSAAMRSIVKKLALYADVNRTDGYKVMLGDGFMLFRESGTEPVIRVYCEGEDAKAFTRIKKEAKGILSKCV
jgi:phosphomannomutase/phosphoglucomutase